MVKHRINLRKGSTNRLKHNINLRGGSTNRGAKIAQLVLLGLFWNGIVVWMYITMLRGLLEGEIFLIFVLLFLTPFVGAGIRNFLIPLILELGTVLGFLRVSLDYDVQKDDLPPIIPPMSPSGQTLMTMKRGVSESAHTAQLCACAVRWGPG